MHRSVIPALLVSGIFSFAALGGGCVIVTQPNPNNGASSATPAKNNRSGLPVHQAGQPATTATATATATATIPPGPPGPKVTVDNKEYTTVSKPIAFGNGNNQQGSFKGFVYFIPETSTQIPNLDTIATAGVLFTQGFSISTTNYSEGFPGLDAGRMSFFAIRYEGDFAVTTPGDYAFKLESDDGAKLIIDSLPLITNDGIHTAQVKTGTVKLSTGPHRFRLEYFQAAPGAAALKLMVTPPGGAEKPFSPML